MSLPADFINELSKHFTGEIRTDLASRILYSTDASIYQMEPRGVVIPRTQDDLPAAVELAAKYRIPILPRGAGTSLAGQAIGDLFPSAERAKWTGLSSPPSAMAALIGLVIPRTGWFGLFNDPT